MAEEKRTQDDQVMAALAHGTAILPFWGLIAAVVIWVTQKEKSRFVAFQALQAMAYHVLPLLGGLLFFLCYLCSFASFFLVFLVIPLAATAPEEMGEGPIALIAVLLSTLPMAIPMP